MPEIHILTSAKGGVGKTTLALTLFDIFDSDIVGLDLNTTNFDFHRIKGRPRKSSNKVYSYPYSENPPMGVFQNEENNDGDDVFLEVPLGINSIMLRRNLGFKLISSSLSFWRLLVAISNKCAAKRAIIVDTNLHPANLVNSGGEDERVELQKEFGFLAKQQVSTVYIWFIWTTATLSPHETPPDIEAIRRFDNEIRKASANHLNVMFMHVLNPQAYLPSVDMPYILAQLV